MLPTHLIVWLALVGILALNAGTVSGQGYPNRPVRIITGDAGSGIDVTSRLIAQPLSISLGQSVIVENKGGSVITAAEPAAKASPDGYTLMLHGNNLWLFPFLHDHVPYDPLNDFSPITLVVSSPAVLVVHPSLPVQSIKELIALAKAKPGGLNYASGPTGSANQLAAELFKFMAGVNIVGINFKGAAPALNAVLAGEMQLSFISITVAAPHIKSGGLRALAVTSAQPSILFPGMPTVASSGLPGYESISMYAMFAPARTPVAIINRLNQELVRLLNQPDMKTKFFDSGVEAVGTSPEQFAVIMKSDMARMGKVIRDAGIKAD